MFEGEWSDGEVLELLVLVRIFRVCTLDSGVFELLQNSLHSDHA